MKNIKNRNLGENIFAGVEFFPVCESWEIYR